MQENFAINASQSYTGDVTWQGIEQQPAASQSRALGENGRARLSSETSERGSKDEAHGVRLLNARLEVSWPCITEMGMLMRELNLIGLTSDSVYFWLVKCCCA